MSIKVLFEIGHESSLKAREVNGFTHDWELFVRSCDSHDISNFIDKVVFNLHDSFAKPKRVFKEPPYVLKESGYAGFLVLIDIYVRNRDDPKKISFQYELDLQNSGPSICRTQTFSYTFVNPSADFRYKLLKGGGVQVSNSSMINNFDERSRDRSTSSMGGSSNGDVAQKKHKSRADDQPRVGSDFAHLFGPPITKTNTLKVSPDPKSHRKSPNRVGAKGPSQVVIASSGTTLGKSVSDKQTTASSSSAATGSSGQKDKSDKSSTSSSKYSSSSRHATSGSPHVSDRGGDKYDRRAGDEKKKDRNRSRDRDKSGGGSGSSKEKSQKRPSSPKLSPSNNSSNHSTNSKSRSPTRPPGGGPEYQKSGASTQSASSSSSKSAAAVDSSSSSKKSKKEKKDKSHDRDRSSVGGESRGDGKRDHRDAKSKDSSKSTAATTSDSKYPLAKESFAKEDKSRRTTAEESSAKKVAEKSGVGATEDPTKDGSDQKRHKHKKKDRKKDDVKDSPLYSTSTTHAPTAMTTTPPLSSAAAAKEKKQSRERVDKVKESSATVASPSTKVKTSTTPTNLSDATKAETNSYGAGVKSDSEPDDGPDAGVAKGRRHDRTVGGEGKRKRRSKEDLSDLRNNSPSKMEPPQKIPRRQLANDSDGYYTKNGGTDSIAEMTGNNYSPRLNSLDGKGSLAGNVIGETYMSELKDLQHKIMTLQDSNDLQQVVEMIASTGKYEIGVTTKTFDFDLCALDKNTVQRLQDFFTARTKR